MSDYKLSKTFPQHLLRPDGTELWFDENHEPEDMILSRDLAVFVEEIRAALRRGKQEGERLGLERAAYFVERCIDPTFTEYAARVALTEAAAAIRALASTPSADWVMLRRSDIEAIQNQLRLWSGASNAGKHLHNIAADLDALLKDSK